MIEPTNVERLEVQPGDLPVCDQVTVDCAIVGAGPAGLMLGLLLARNGVEVLVLEQHADFLRDFRGDTIHPSTLEIMAELGLLDGLLRLPHTRATALHAEIGGSTVTLADFARLPTQCRFIAFMPQWDFLTYLCGEASKYSTFRFAMNAKVVGLDEGDGAISGLRAIVGGRELHVRSRVVIGADGRNSVVRAQGRLEVETFGSPSDVLWMRLSKQPDDPPYQMGHGGPRQGFVMIDRGEYWQCGYVVRKGTFDNQKARGLNAFREAIAAVSPLPPDRVSEIQSWDDVHLLSIRIDRLKKWWRSGLICIGDAAHAMSPIGGVGVNLAIQDAVATANILSVPLLKKQPLDRYLAAVQARRSFPTKATQKIQLMMRSKRRVDADADGKGPPAFLKSIAKWPLLAHLSGRLIGTGFRPEHVQEIDRRDIV